MNNSPPLLTNWFNVYIKEVLVKDLTLLDPVPLGKFTPLSNITPLPPPISNSNSAYQ